MNKLDLTKMRHNEATRIFMSKSAEVYKRAGWGTVDWGGRINRVVWPRATIFGLYFHPSLFPPSARIAGRSIYGPSVPVINIP
jgi:hypothetical protein